MSDERYSYVLHLIESSGDESKLKYFSVEDLADFSVYLEERSKDMSIYMYLKLQNMGHTNLDHCQPENFISQIGSKWKLIEDDSGDWVVAIHESTGTHTVDRLSDFYKITTGGGYAVAYLKDGKYMILETDKITKDAV